jgi:RNA polymerase sigma-70 factor, ECF subfamily
MTIPSVQSVVPPGLEFVMLELYQKSRGAEFGLSREQFAAILKEVAAKYLPAESQNSDGDWKDLWESLRLEDLALARACAAGNERAWEVFLLRFREKLYDIAGYITKESAAARELADGLYADLYGTDARQGQRVSKLASYNGRGSLDGWLRTVMTQEYINRYRRQRKLVSLDEKEEDGAVFAAPDPAPAIVVDARVETATDEALAALSAEERFLLASYYLDGRTLADIARQLDVHESTISRKLDRLANSLRKQIIATLAKGGMSHRQAQEAMEVDVRDLQVNIRTLTQKVEGESFPEKKVQPQTGDGAG